VIGSPSPGAGHHASLERQDVYVTAKGLSAENVYVQSVGLNGKAWVSPFLPFEALKNGGTIEFTMGPQPNRSWGVGQSVPQQALGR
jgi:putative alpha-1,2-mannosidase